MPQIFELSNAVRPAELAFENSPRSRKKATHVSDLKKI
jgi:hypothetical protein